MFSYVSSDGGDVFWLFQDMSACSTAAIADRDVSYFTNILLSARTNLVSAP
jgi:hypothetical protein